MITDADDSGLQIKHKHTVYRLDKGNFSDNIDPKHGLHNPRLQNYTHPKILYCN